jgi:hypothetical protein
MHMGSQPDEAGWAGLCEDDEGGDADVADATGWSDYGRRVPSQVLAAHHLRGLREDCRSLFRSAVGAIA